MLTVTAFWNTALTEDATSLTVISSQRSKFRPSRSTDPSNTAGHLQLRARVGCISKLLVRYEQRIQECITSLHLFGLRRILM
jgi:hypothetical protein